MRLTMILFLVALLNIGQCHQDRVLDEINRYPPKRCERPAVVIQCSTDTDCMLKNGGDGSPSPRV